MPLYNLIHKIHVITTLFNILYCCIIILQIRINLSILIQSTSKFTIEYSNTLPSPITRIAKIIHPINNARRTVPARYTSGSFYIHAAAAACALEILLVLDVDDVRDSLKQYDRSPSPNTRAAAAAAA